MARGQVLLRMPEALHRELITRAQEQGISMNQLIVALLAGSTGFTLNPEEQS